MPKGIQGFQKGNQFGRISKRGKGKKTLLQEERRALFDEKISKKWSKIIDKLPPVYIADQYLGKASEVLNHTIQFKEYATLLENNGISKNNEDNKAIEDNSRRDSGGEDSSDSDVSDSTSDTG